jgi:hypothetical protein
LFDYINSHETEHYRQLLMKLSETITFSDLSEAARSGIRKLTALEGKYAFFVGGVHSKRPKRPIPTSKPIDWRFKTTRVEITWDGDAKYLMSSSAIGRQGGVNRYIVYGLVRTVHKPVKGPIQVTCSPLLVAQPTTYVDRTPPRGLAKECSGRRGRRRVFRRLPGLMRFPSEHVIEACSHQACRRRNITHDNVLCHAQSGYRRNGRLG